MAKLVSKAYGDALFQLAIEENRTDEFLEQVNTIQEAFKQNPELLKLLKHPQITKEEKEKVIENIFKGRIDDNLTGLLVLLIKKDRQDDIDAVIKYFVSRVKEYKNIGTAYVTSAVELTADIKRKIEEKLLNTTQYETFEMHFAVDNSLIGGLVIRVGDRVVDSSLKYKINELSKELQKIQLS
ncbi:MAG: ATP synthase F1 subunit delta [Eubacterium sp.]